MTPAGADSKTGKSSIVRSLLWATSVSLFFLWVFYSRDVYQRHQAPRWGTYLYFASVIGLMLGVVLFSGPPRKGQEHGRILALVTAFESLTNRKLTPTTSLRAKQTLYWLWGVTTVFLIVPLLFYLHFGEVSWFGWGTALFFSLLFLPISFFATDFEDRPK